MRARAMLFGGLMASLFPPTSGANAFIVNIDPMTRQPLVATSQPGATYGSQTYGGQIYRGPSTGATDRYAPGPGQSYGNSAYYRYYGGQYHYGGQYYAPGYGAPSQAQSMTPIPRQVVEFHSSHPPGSVVINTSERRLYYVLGNGQAIRYGIGVGREGFQWAGVHHVTTKREWPDWRPPAQMLRRQPYLPRYMPGGPNNPLGARAMYIGSTLYRIHGSNEPHTIGQAVSSGCIRMTNEDVIDLYERVRVGAKVVVQR